MLHRVRLMLNRQRTQLSIALRAHLSEFGIVASVRRNGIEQLLAIINDESDERVPPDLRVCLKMLEAQLIVVKEQILENDRRVRVSARETDVGRRLMEISGVGPLLASCLCCDDRRSTRIQVGSLPICLDWPRSETELKRRQGKTWQHIKGWQSLSAPIAGGWRNSGYSIRRTEWNQASVARATYGKAKRQDCGGGTCQQDRPDGLGIDDER